MAALDFPASPTVGQIATLTNGFSYQWDGAVWTLAPATGVVLFYLVAGSLVGVPTASLSAGFYVAALSFTLPSSLAGSQAVAKVAATAQTDFDVRVNGVSKGTMRWAPAATVATFIFAAAVTLAVGDRLELVAPATPDATLSDPTWTLRGTLP